MTSIKNRLVRGGLTLALAGLVAAGSVMPAMAAEKTLNPSITVASGGLNFGVAPAISSPFAGITLNGTDQTDTAELGSFRADDLTGTGDGWTVSVQASQFSNVGASRQLVIGSLEMAAPTVSAAGDTTSPEPTLTSGPYPIDNGSPVTIATAAANEGMGQYTFGATELTLSIPADAYTDTYSSTLTITLAATP